MRVRLASACVAVCGLIVSASGCAMATNYLTPSGPRHVGAHTAAPPEDATHVRVVTFNIAHATHVPEAIEALRANAALNAPDVLALQEMDAAGVESIARELRLNYVYYPASRGPGDERDMGEALLSPWPIEGDWKVPLPHLTLALRRSRAAVAARIRIGHDAVVVYSVHLGSPWGMGPGGRRDQAAAVLADAQDRPEPIVVAGDFNSKGVVGLFESAGFSWPTRDVGRTAGPFRFDHIVARGLTPVVGRPAGVVREINGASDHRPVWVVLNGPSANKRGPHPR